MIELCWFQYDYIGEAPRKAVVCLSGCGESKKAALETEHEGKEEESMCERVGV